MEILIDLTVSTDGRLIGTIGLPGRPQPRRTFSGMLELLAALEDLSRDGKPPEEA